MFKKLSKVLFSLSLAVLTVGAGLLAFGGNSKANASNDLSITIEGNTYTLEGKDYNGEVFYAIDTPEDLALVSFMVSTVRDKNWAGYNFELKNDINLSSRAWTAIGTYDNPYSGKFNGNGFTINGLNASKDACESEVFYKEDGSAIVELVHGNYYYDTVNEVYYRYLNGMIDTNNDSVADTNAVRGFVLQEGFDPTGKTVTNVTPKQYYYYGLFGNVVGASATDKAEISDVVMGKGCFAYRNNDKLEGKDVEAYSGILVAKSDKAKFYNVYDAMADADTKYSEEYYILTTDAEIVSGKKYYTYDTATSKYTLVASPVVENIATYYEMIYRVDTGLYTYYYNFNTTQISLYRDETMTASSHVVTFAINENENGSFIADDKAYYYDINFTTGIICLNLKERYIVNEVVSTTIDGETTTINSIEIDGVTYYLRDRAAGGFWLTTANEDPASDSDAVFYLTADTRAEGWITLNEKTYPYVYENEVFKVLAFSEVCTFGYMTGDNTATADVTEGCEFYKGNYYRLNSIEYVGIGSIDDNATHDGILNVLGATYYYDFNMEGNENRLILYSGDYPKYTGVGNDVGVGTIAIGGVDYYFDYDLEYGDLDISSINNYITDIPYTIAKVEGDVKVEKLEKGTIFSFNVATPAGESMAYYYKKGTADYITAYRMIYEEGVGLSTLDYNSNFVTAATTLPQNYFDADNGEYYVISDTAGYLFENWTVPTADGRVAIVSTAKMEVEGTLKDVLCSFAPATGLAVSDVAYYTYNADTNDFAAATVEVGVTDVSSMYELIDQDATIENIKANNYQVNANWTTKNYSVTIEVDGTATTATVGYGMKWDTYISGLTLDGHDLTGVYYYETGVTTGSTDSNEKVFAYGLNYFYDNYGNLTTYSFLKTTDTTVDTSKIYYTATIVGGFAKFTEVEIPDETVISTYYEKAENVAVYGEQLSSGKSGISFFMVNWEEDNLYLYTTWQRQPVNGKVTFSNNGDDFILTKDTSLVDGKKYYTRAENVYTLVTTPNAASLDVYYEETQKYLLNKFNVGTMGYVQTRDTMIVEGKTYFTKEGTAGDDSDYVAVATPSLSALATYYERAVANGFEGIAMAPSVNDAGTNYFVKLATDDANDKFGFTFKTNTGYSVNYIVPSTTGTASEADVNYFTWDAAQDKLIHKYYDATETKILTAEIAEENYFVGYFNSATHFTEVKGVGATSNQAQHGSSQTNSFVLGKYYVDLYTGTSDYLRDGYAEVYVAEEVTLADGTTTEVQLVPCATIHKNGVDYTFRQSKFTSNSYNLYVDIARDVYQIKLTVTDYYPQDESIDYYVQSVVVKEDGVITETTDEIHKLTSTNTEPTYINVRYDSNYEIVVTPAANYSIADYGAYNMTALTAQETATGLYLLTNSLSGLTFSKEENGVTVAVQPEYIFTMKESTFNVYGEYSFPDGEYVSGAVVPTLSIQSLKDADTDLTNQYVKPVPQNDVVNFGQGANVLITGNAYYYIDRVYGYIFTVAQDASGLYLDKVNKEGVTVVDTEFDEYFAVVNYNGKDYYVERDAAQFNDDTVAGRYDLVNATLYARLDYDGNSTINDNDIIEMDMNLSKGIPAGILGNNDVLKLVPVLKKQMHNITSAATGVLADDGLSMNTIKDIQGNDTVSSGNFVSVSDNAGVDKTQYCYEDQIVLTYDLNDDFYIFTGFYIEVNGAIYPLATQDASTKAWTKGIYFDSTSGQTQLGTVVANGDNSIKVTFDKVAPSEVQIYAAFDGKTVNLAVGDVKNGTTILLDAVVENYDGNGDYKDYTFSTSDNIISTSSSIQSIKFGKLDKQSIVYRLSADATMNLVGWAVYDAAVMNGTLEDKITVIYNYAEALAATGADATVSMDYYELFTQSADVSVLENLFNGSSQYTLIPVLQQKTATIKLTNAALDGDGNGTVDGETGADVEGLTYYAGGEGLDISDYADDFAKVGYTPTGWQAVTGVTYSTSSNLIDLRAISLAGLYGSTITVKRVYEANVYDIYFEMGAGEEIDEGNYAGTIKKDKANPYIEATFDDSYALPQALKTGYTFNGWYLKGNAVPVSAGDYFAANGTYKTPDNTTLVPHFTPNTYSVMVNANGGKINGTEDATKTISVVYDTILYTYSEVGSAPTRAGYTFAGWYAKVGENVKAISNTDILSVSLNESGKNYVNLAGAQVLSLVAAWTRNDGYYTLTPDTAATMVEYTHNYSAQEELFEAISAINAGATNIITTENVGSASIAIGNSDNASFTWKYSATGNEGSYAASEKTAISNFKAVSLKDVVDTGYYKLTITIAQTDVDLITEVMRNQSTYTLEKVIKVTITPRTINVNDLESSYSGVFDGTAYPIQNFNEVYDNVNITSVNIHSYEVGTIDGDTFTAGKNVGSYNAVRFYFAFASGYEYVAGNYVGVGGTAGNYYFDQLLGDDAITITQRDITLYPVVTKIAYTNGAQTILFTTRENVNSQEIVFTANGTLTTFGSATTDTEVQSSTLTISDKAITTTGIEPQYLTVSNYNYILGEEITILANVLNYSLSGRILTKDTSDATDFTLPDVVEDEAIVVDAINVSSIAFAPNATEESTEYKKFTMGSITYFYSNDLNTLYFQMINNAVEVKIYSMTAVESLTLASDNLVYSKSGVEYYLFGVYEIPAANAAEVASNLLKEVTSENATNRFFNTLEANKEYYVGYTNLVATTLNGLGEAGTESEVKFVKLGSPLTTAGFNPTRVGYDFVGWELDEASEDVTIPAADQKQFTINTTRESIAPLSLTAQWQLLAPTVETTNAITRNASEGEDTITAAQVIGSITNRNNYLTYTYNWYKGDVATGEALSSTEVLTLEANTDSNGAYTLVIGIEGSALTTPVVFQVTFNQVAVHISNDTRADKVGYFDDGAQTLTDGNLTFKYVYGRSYQAHIYLDVEGNRTSTTEYKLSDYTDGNIRFTITKGGAGVSTITDAGTYTINLEVNSKIYKIEGRNTINVVVEKAEVTFTDGIPATNIGLYANLRAVLGIATEEIFTKTFGENNNTTLIKTFYIKKDTNQFFATAAEAGTNAQEVQIIFSGQDQILISGAGEAEQYDGIRYNAATGLQAGTRLGQGKYAITNAHSENANYTFLVSATEGLVPELQILPNANDAMVFRIKEAKTFTYGDTVITRVALNWNGTAWELQGFDSSDAVKVTWEFDSIAGTGVSYLNDQAEISKYEIAINATNYPDGFKLAGNFIPQNALTVKALDGAGASLTKAEFGNIAANFLVITKAQLTVTAVTKPCDTTNTFDSEEAGNIATIEGLKFTDSVYVTGIFASTAFGTGINVTGLALKESAVAVNYELASETTTGSITASSIVVSINLAETTFNYGLITKLSVLDEIFGFNFTSTEIATIDRDYFTISGLKIVDNEGNVVDTYSTGLFLNAGTYKLQYTVASQSFATANTTATLEFEVRTMQLEPHTEGYVEITKIYNGNNAVEQTIVIDTLSGDVVTITAVYDNANVGPGKTVTLTKSGADAANYVLSTSTLTGAITERDGVQIIGHNDTIAFVADSNNPVLDGATLDASGNFILTVSPYNDETEATTITTVLGTPTRVGYNFGGWFTDSNCTIAYSEATIIDLINAHIASANGAQPFSVYAKWTIKSTDGSTYAVEKNVGAHTTITVEEENYNYYDTVVFTISSATGYDISNLRVYNKSTGVDIMLTTVEAGKYSFTLPDASVVIATTATPQVYEIAIENNGGVGTNPTTHTYGTDTEINDLTRDGYTFLGWVVNATGEPQKDLTLAGNGYTGKITLDARWEANTYKVYFNLDATETFSTDMITTHSLVLDEEELSPYKGQYYKVVTFDGNFTLPVTNKPGYGFVDWRVAGGEVFAEGIYTVVGDTVLTATYEAGTFTITFNPTKVTINVYDSNNTPDRLMTNNGNTYEFIGGKTYYIEVIADAGYTVQDWSFDGVTNVTNKVLAEVTPVESKTIDIFANPNENTISLYINEQDAPHVEFTVEVNDIPVSLTDITGGKSFTALTDAKVEVLVTVASGYSLNNPVAAGMTFAKDENLDFFTISGFTADASISFRLTALSYEIKVNIDEDRKVTSLSILNANSYEQDASGNFWTANVTTGQGNNLQLKPEVVIGYSFIGVKYLNTTIGLNQTESDIEDSGVNISVTQEGLVTITGYTSGIEITLLTAIEEYELNLEIYALDDDKKNDTTVTKSLKVNEVDYVAGQKVMYGSEITISAEVSSVGYKFIGWYTTITTSGQGVVDYAYQISADAAYTLTMSNENIRYYAIFERSYVELSLNVLTNEDATNAKGGKIENASGNEVLTERVLYKAEVSYTATVNRGYEFKGWFVENATGDKVEASTVAGITVDETRITIVASEAFKVYAKFEAKPLTISITQGLLVNGILTYPTGLNYGSIVWGTYANGTFTPDAQGTNPTIQTRTDDIVYVKATAQAGYLIDQIINTGTARFTITEVEESDEYSIYELSGMNSEDGEYAFIVRFYSTETILTINYKTTNENIVIAGDAEITPSEGIMIKANRTANVVITAVTGSTITVRAYSRLGYHFDKDEETRQLVYTVGGTYRGTLNITNPIIPQRLDDVSLGYTEVADFVISGYAGGQIELSLGVVPSKYTIKLYGVDENLKPLDKAFTTITNVAGGSIISLSGQNKKDISELPVYEGYTLQGFYTYASGSGTKYIDANGNGIELNDNGYYWTGSEYKKLPYYTEDVNGNGTFSLFAVYTINKTAITISASPYGLTHTAPTLENKVVLETLNSANSWTVETDKYYAEVLHGAVINATAPKFTGYKFAYWKVDRYDIRGEKLPTRYNVNEKITDVLESTNTSANYTYSALKLTAIYNVHAEVEATNGGSAEIKGYTYTISSDMQGATPVEKITSGEFDFSSLEAIVYRATPSLGYTFMGWHDAEGNIVSSALEYEIPATRIAPTYLKAVFEGDAKTLKVSADSSNLGVIVSVTVMRENAEGIMEEVAVPNYAEGFAVKVGEQVYIYMNIPDQRYEATWEGGDVETDLPGEYRKYIYTVSAEDEVSADTIAIHASYVSREFAVSVEFDLENKVSNEELKLMGELKHNAKLLASGQTLYLYYGNVFVMNISANKNYKVLSVLVDETEVVDDEKYFKNGTLRIQTSDYDYMFTQSVSIKVKFARVLWYDDIEETYTLTGKGTSENPYKIASEEDLAFVAYMINVEGNSEYASAAYELMKDLDLTGKYWSPIGTINNPFSGSFDYNVFEVTGIAVVFGYKDQSSHEGLFGFTSNAHIFRTESNIGIIIGIVAGVVGVAGIGVGIFFGLRAKKKRELEKLANS